MISKALQTFADDISLKVDNDCVFGVYKDYMITISERGKSRNLFINYYLMDSEDDALKKFRLSETIKNDMNDFYIKEFYIEDNGLVVEFRDSISQLSEYIDKLIGILISEDISGENTCSECGKNRLENEKFKTVSLNQNRYKLCDSCTLELVQNTSQNDDDKKEVTLEGKVWTGILGAVIGLLVGSVIWNFLATLGIVTMWMGFAVSLLSYLGYTFLKGRKGNSRIIILSVISFIGVALNSFSSEVIKVLKLAGISFQKFMLVPFSYIQVATETENFDLSMTFIIALLCAALAIVIFATDLLKDKPKPPTIKIE